MMWRFWLLVIHSGEFAHCHLTVIICVNGETAVVGVSEVGLCD